MPWHAHHVNQESRRETGAFRSLSHHHHHLESRHMLLPSHADTQEKISKEVETCSSTHMLCGALLARLLGAVPAAALLEIIRQVLLRTAPVFAPEARMYYIWQAVLLLAPRARIEQARRGAFHDHTDDDHMDAMNHADGHLGCV
jgi:hypothetical protein